MRKETASGSTQPYNFYLNTLTTTTRGLACWLFEGGLSARFCLRRPSCYWGPFTYNVRQILGFCDPSPFLPARRQVYEPRFSTRCWEFMTSIQYVPIYANTCTIFPTTCSNKCPHQSSSIPRQRVGTNCSNKCPQ